MSDSVAQGQQRSCYCPTLRSRRNPGRSGVQVSDLARGATPTTRGELLEYLVACGRPPLRRCTGQNSAREFLHPRWHSCNSKSKSAPMKRRAHSVVVPRARCTPGETEGTPRRALSRHVLARRFESTLRVVRVVTAKRRGHRRT
jgi:hypothetical protein